MARKRYRSGIGINIYIGTSLFALASAVAILIWAFLQNEQYRAFKNDTVELASGPKSFLTTEYNGETTPLSKQSFSKIFLLMTNGRRSVSMGGEILDAFTIHFVNLVDKGEMTISKTSTPYMKVTFATEAKNKNYTFWFQCAAGYGSMLKIATTPAG